MAWRLEIETRKISNNDFYKIGFFDKSIITRLSMLSKSSLREDSAKNLLRLISIELPV